MSEKPPPETLLGLNGMLGKFTSDSYQLPHSSSSSYQQGPHYKITSNSSTPVEDPTPAQASRRRIQPLSRAQQKEEAFFKESSVSVMAVLFGIVQATEKLTSNNK